MTILSYTTVDFYLQVAKMVIVIAVAFILTWSPHYLVSITSVLQKSFQKTHIFDKENYVFTMLMTYFFGLANSCMNPLIYNAMSTAFKRRFRATLRRLFCRPFARRWDMGDRSSSIFDIQPSFRFSLQKNILCRRPNFLCLLLTKTTTTICYNSRFIGAVLT